jgi:hypothetical protein
MGIEPEPLGWKALRSLTAGGTKRRDDGFDLAVFKGGVDPSHAIDRIRRDPARGSPEGIFDSVQALGEPARVVLFAGHDFVVPEARLRQSCPRHACGATSTTTPARSSTAVCCLQAGREPGPRTTSPWSRRGP